MSMTPTPEGKYPIGYDDRIVDLPGLKYSCFDILSFVNGTREHFGLTRLKEMSSGVRRGSRQCPVYLALKDIGIDYMGMQYSYIIKKGVADKLAAFWDVPRDTRVRVSGVTCYRVTNARPIFSFITLFDGGAFSEYDKHNYAGDDGTWR